MDPERACLLTTTRVEVKCPYQPDLLYFEGGIPFGDVGRRMVAHYYIAKPGINSLPWQTDTCIGNWF